MIVNGSGDPNDVVWQTTVAVNPNTQYTFSAWARTIRNKTNLSNNQRANLRFKINGVQIGSDFMCPKTHSYWAHFEQVWNSGNATSATIQIYDVNTNAESGNDFGLDDIELKSGNDLCGSEELTVLVMDPIMAPPAICAGGSLVLTEPTVYGASGYGRWEVSPTLNGTYFPLGNSGVPVSYNGYYLRYAFNYNGDWYFSNVVTLAVDAPVVVNIQAESTELCEGESVTINATVNTQEYYHVGDILCTDGTIVKASNWPCGKTAKGVVFYVDPSGRHGWAVSKVSQNDNIRWGSSQFSQHDIPDLYNFDNWRDAIRDFDGYSNTQKILAYSSVSSTPSASFPAVYAAVGYGDGWYLPSAGQLNVLFGEILVVNSSLGLSGLGGTPISPDKALWSSTEFFTTSSVKHAVKLELKTSSAYSTGRINDASKKDYESVRAVINF